MKILYDPNEPNRASGVASFDEMWLFPGYYGRYGDDIFAGMYIRDIPEDTGWRVRMAG